MIVSMNEIESTMLKAARGAGYAWGLAEEASIAARWLATWDLPWLETAHILFSPESLRWIGSDTPLRNPLLAGAWSNDLPISCSARSLRGVTAPLWLAGLVGAGTHRRSIARRINWSSAEVVVARGALVHTHGTLDAAATETVSITLAGNVDPVSFGGSVATHRRSTGCHVDARLWQRLLEYEKRTYVPGSAQSRATGAGSEKSDND